MEKNLRNKLEQEFAKLGNSEPWILKVESVFGGSINHSYKVQTKEHVYFVKTNTSSSFPQMFEKEALGLMLLSSSKAIRVPSVLAYGAVDNTAYLILEFIERSVKSHSFWENFGRQLAELHHVSADHFGLDHDNYIGSLPQLNKKVDNWADFFIEQRLQAQLKMAVDCSIIESSVVKDFNLLFPKIATYFPIEKSSLLHGDLWSGNFMIDGQSNAVIVDPAVYFGHREMDIAMSRLFGGFHNRFYDAYNECFPMEVGWEERLDTCNLYPLLVHLNLFGGGYLNSIKSILRTLV